MGKDEILNYFYTNSADLGINSMIIIMFGGLVIGAFIYLTYFITYRGVAYNAKFNASLIIILLICVVIMLMISSNIVISLGMVGALSIVRFRTAVKDSRDTVFIFWAIAEGLSVGSQNFKLALVTTLFIGIVVAGVSFIPGGRNKYLMIVRGREESIDHTELMAAIRKAAPYIKLRSLNKEETHQEMIFEVRVRGELGAEKLNQIFDVKGVKAVNWVAESGENVG
ncbi:MAG: DUF4956 domain-containing protein [Dorea sp.]|jgi:uncharacterized membrane protein YhiD involved in acid resistance|nr:DUF4956 domain-containing protein [Dorea sp.]